MSVTLDEVRAVASLARLEFTSEEQQVLIGELNDILRYVEQLNELDTDKIEPTSHVLPLFNAFRGDHSEVFSVSTELTKNAPDTDGPLYKVPRIID
ncbi:MAG: Asp-tRNA(Asn)/Glu-tRNA(Gln) amidotransferase subunit GatC [Candidatus Latescibacterota bacterium]|nr:Asp-tRNA(Asn)/Glu-tRNA(Gln) amidotransferase subunit GatC [Candidatus Latescibacterota bacterium]